MFVHAYSYVILLIILVVQFQQADKRTSSKKDPSPFRKKCIELLQADQPKMCPCPETYSREKRAERHCDDSIPEMENAGIVQPGWYKHVTVTFKCKDGYFLVGNNTVICREDRTWSPLNGSCIESCPEPIIYNGKWLKERLDVGEITGQAFCERGYVYNGPSESLKCDNLGRWIGTIGNCSDISRIYCRSYSPKPPAIVEPVFKEKAPYNSEIHISCSRGIYNGSKIRRCQYNGTWSGTDGLCSGDGNDPALEDKEKDVTCHTEHQLCDCSLVVGLAVGMVILLIIVIVMICYIGIGKCSWTTTDSQNVHGHNNQTAETEPMTENENENGNRNKRD